MADNRWNPDLYLRFEVYRSRAARDLLARVNLCEPQAITDLGCGPGNSTALLAQRWPTANITGVDNSAVMLQRARDAYPQITWVEANLANWQPSGRQDLIFANASLHWTPDHASVLRNLCAFLGPKGVLAFQVPSIHEQPAAEVYRRLIDSPKWHQFASTDEPLTVEAPAFYHDALEKHFQTVEVWETIYHHLLATHEEIAVWYRSTGLRPFLAGLPDDRTRAAFVDELAACYRERFPALADGRVLFPFRRLFVLATRWEPGWMTGDV